MVVISRVKFQISGVVGSLGENLNFFSPVGFDVKTNTGHKTQNIKLYSVRASTCYLNEKNLIHGRVMATISNLVHRFLKHTLAGCPNGASLRMPYIIMGVYEKFSREFHQ